MNPNVTVIQPTITAKQEQKIRVAAYCRVSSDSTDQLNSFMTQMRYYENFLAGSETETLVSVYADEGVTGTRIDKREDFQRMLKDCRRGKIDRIIAKSISRFARNTKECLTVIRELKSLGITVLFEKENIDTANISDEMMITLMGGLAQEESVSISQNMQWSIQRRMRSGTYIVSHLPYGYQKVDGKFVINEEEAKIVRRIFAEFLQGNGLNAICMGLNYDGIRKDQSGNLWRKKSIRYILTNEKYIGDCLWMKKITENVFPFKKSVNCGQVDQFYVENDHDAIISRTDFAVAQRLLQRKSNHFGNYEFHTYPLSKKMHCGNCGAIFKRKYTSDKVFWVCRNHDFRAENCEIKRIAESVIYEAFIQVYNKLKSQYSMIFPPLVNQLQELKNRKFSGNQQYMEIAKEIAKLKEQTHVLARLKTKGFLDEAKYLEQTVEINAKLNKLNRELRKTAQSDEEDEVINQMKEIASIIENGMDWMTEFDEILFESLVEKIIVKDQITLEFYLYGGLKFTERLV